MSGISLSMRRACVWVGALVIGFLGGQWVYRQPSADATAGARDFIVPQRGFEGGPGRSGTKAVEVPPDLRSTDTLEVLLTVSHDELYERLALWLADSTVEDIAAYWSATKDLEAFPSRVRDLLFVMWTSLDPHGAIAAAQGTSSALTSWSAWARSDPRAAFAHALAHDPARVGDVLRSIGESDPELALQFLKEHPELPTDIAHHGIVQGLARNDPEAAFKFAFEHAQRFQNSEPIEAWVREDPHAVFDWILANLSNLPWQGDHQPVIATLSREHPELLAEFTAKLPPGSFRRRFEAAAFELLLATEPDKALEQARAHPSTLIATRQLTKIALLTVGKDPDKAITLLGEIMAKDPDFIFHRTGPISPDRFSHSTEVSDEGLRLIVTLTKSDPQGTFDQMMAANPEGRWNGTIRHAASTWISTDHDSFATWVEGQSDDALRMHAYQQLIGSMSHSRNFEAATTYLERLDPEDRRMSVGSMLGMWQSVDPAAARQWAETHGINPQNP